MWKQLLMCVAWPAFLAASALEMLVFATVDPQDLQWFGHALNWSPQAIYTTAFFVFWCVVAAASMLSWVLAVAPADVSGRPAD